MCDCAESDGGVGSISASPTACLLRGYGRASTRNDRLGEPVILSTGTRVPAQWTRHRRCRYVVMALVSARECVTVPKATVGTWPAIVWWKRPEGLWRCIDAVASSAASSSPAVSLCVVRAGVRAGGKACVRARVQVQHHTDSKYPA